MSNPADPASRRALSAGVAAYQAGRLEDALHLLAPLNDPRALNLAGVCARKLGRADAAHAAFERAAALAPNDPEIANNQGHFELARGHLEAAERHFSRALAAAPGLAAAHIGRARVAAAKGDWETARPHWEAVLAANPASVQGRYGLATARMESGEAEAAAHLLKSLHAERDRPETAFMLGRAQLELGELAAAEALLASAHARAPADHTLRTLANLYWMSGEQDRFHSLVTDAPAELSALAVKLLLETGQTERAQAAWSARYGAREPDADGWTLAALIAREAGDGAATEAAAGRALALQPDHAAACDCHVVAALMTGRPDLALARLAPLRRDAPLAQHWIAHESVARRLLDETEQRGLNEAERFVRTYEIDVPEGYTSLAAFNAELADALRAQHRFSARPLNQSLRGAGTQTARSLLDSGDPVITAYIAALERPIDRYIADIGGSPDHPTTARNNGTWRFAGMWSVRLTREGYHAPHVHPSGWISSAYYAAVPEATAEATDKAGWIGFGQPAYATEPGLDVLKWVAPRAGLLVLFPSWMWHGTQPVARDGERITAPFDLLPG